MADIGCVRCTAALSGDFDRATRYDAERGLRMIIALIQLDMDRVEEIQGQIGDCPECWKSIAGYFHGILSGQLIDQFGREGAAVVAQATLDEVLKSPDLLNPPPTGYAKPA